MSHLHHDVNKKTAEMLVVDQLQTVYLNLVSNSIISIKLDTKLY